MLGEELPAIVWAEQIGAKAVRPSRTKNNIAAEAKNRRAALRCIRLVPAILVRPTNIVDSPVSGSGCSFGSSENRDPLIHHSFIIHPCRNRLGGGTIRIFNLAFIRRMGRINRGNPLRSVFPISLNWLLFPDRYNRNPNRMVVSGVQP